MSAVVAMLTRRLRLPYRVGLVAAGIALALLPWAPKISFTKELIFDLLLPPLLFEAAFYLRWMPARAKSNRSTCSPLTGSHSNKLKP